MIFSTLFGRQKLDLLRTPIAASRRPGRQLPADDANRRRRTDAPCPGEAIACFQRALEFDPSLDKTHSSLVYTQLYSPGFDAPALHETSLQWSRRHAEPLATLTEPHSNARLPDRRLRVGYVSPNFREHCQTLFTTPLFASHDPEGFEIFCYSDVHRPDIATERIRVQVNAWREIAGLTDEQVCEQIRRDEIDILVDLTMHMDGARLLVFARKPAPVQICWLAYPGSTGLSTIDYRLTDPYLDPPGLFDRYYSEESIRLPETFWCYDPLDRDAAVSSLPAAANGSVTFGCLNNSCKINELAINLWARVLEGVPRSRLVLLASVGSHREQTLNAFEARGIARDRVTFVGFQPRGRYLRCYEEIDIGLDTFPYNGHTTSLDSFWMGVPVVTLVGSTVVGRAGLSQLTNLGLQELIAFTPEQYVQIAAELAQDFSRLSRLRATLRERMESSPLMDGPRFARNVEAAFRKMWQRWCEK